MLTVHVWGLPRLPQEALRNLHAEISVHFEKITSELVQIWYPPDSLEASSGTVLIEVAGSYAVGGEKLFKTIAHKIKELVPECKIVQYRLTNPSSWAFPDEGMGADT